MIRLLIADDQLLFRSMLEEMLSRDSDIKLVASCGDGLSACEESERHKPDVAILDIGMPVISGLDALRKIKTVTPRTKTIMLTTFESSESIAMSADLGADGYLVKDIKPDVLIMAVKCVHNGIVLFHRSSYDLALRGVSTQRVQDKKIEVGNIVFDSVDIEIIKYIALGKTNREIAAALNYSEGTIKNRVSKILGMTGFSERTEISVFALKNRII